MKKIIFSVIAILTYSFTFSQTTATDFTTTDCAGTSHHLFAELDAGKIIVVAFVMPCGMCTSPSLAAYNAVQSYATSNPGQILFYLVSDDGTAGCSTINNWGNSSSMPLSTKFSSPAFVMSDYGTPGMPKIVVLGGTNHAVVYNKNSGVSTTNVQTAINGLLASAGISEITETNNFNLKVIPNPANENFQFEYSLDKSSSVQIEIFSLTGELVFKNHENNQISGEHKINLDEKVNLENGMYLLKLTTDSKTQSINFVIEK